MRTPSLDTPGALLLLLSGACRGAGEPGEAPGLLDSGAPGFDRVQVQEVETTLDEDFPTLLTVHWEQGAASRAWVEYSVDEGVWMSSPPREVPAGPVAQLLLGLPFEHELIVRIANDFGPGPLYSEPFDASTGASPPGLPLATVLRAEPVSWDPDTPWLLLSLSNVDETGMFTLILDRQGRAVWARPNRAGTAAMHPRLSHDGTQLLIDESTFWSVFDGGRESSVVRMHIDGTVVEIIDTPGLHHPFTELPDGSLAWPAHEAGDEHITVRAPDGSSERIFACRAFQEQHGYTEAWCGSNTLWYDPRTERFLYSLYSSQAVLELDRQGTVLRHFGQLEGAWSFEPADAAFWWQHGAHLTEQGTLLLSSELREDGEETVVREYALDDERQTLQLVWSYGEGEGILAEVMGEAHRLPGGNTLHNYGSATRVRELSPEGDIVWDVDWDTITLGRSEPLEDLYALLP
jgi:hypothetical protein